MLKRYLTSCLILLFACYSVAGCSSQHKEISDSSSSEQTRRSGDVTPKEKTFFTALETPPLKSYDPPQGNKVTLNNGVVVYLLENHNLPLISVNVRVHTGSFWEPADKVGLASITGSIMRSGGTKSMDPDTMNQILEDIGASVEAGIGSDSGSVSMSCLTKDLDTVFDIFVDVMRHPAFREDKIEVATSSMRSGISRRNDAPGGIASRELGFELYGRDSVYARELLPSHLDAISQQDLIEYHKTFFQPANFLIGVGGDFDQQDMLNRLNATIGSWPVGQAVTTSFPKADMNQTRSVAVAHKPELVQSNVLMAQLCDLDRLHPDYVPLYVAGNILGRGFSSRLFQEVRTKASLAYSVGGGYRPQYAYPGMVQFSAQTKTESTAATIRLMLKTIDTMGTDPVTDEELALTKEGILNSFVFQFASPGANLSRQIRYHFRDLPQDYIQTFQDGIRKTTKEDILRVSKKYFKTKDMLILVVGNKEAFDSDLREFGPVHDLDMSLPAPPKTDADALNLSAAAAAQAQAMLQKWLSKSDSKTLTEMKGIFSKGSRVMKMGGQEMPGTFENTSTVDGNMFMKGSMGPMEISVIVNEDGVFANTPMTDGFDKLPTDQAEGVREQNKFDFALGLLKGLHTGTLKAHLQGEDKDGLSILLISDSTSESAARVFLDTSIWQPAKMEMDTPMGVMVTELSGYKEMDGLFLPTTMTTKDPNGMTVILTIKTLEVLETIDAELFQVPE